MKRPPRPRHSATLYAGILREALAAGPDGITVRPEQVFPPRPLGDALRSFVYYHRILPAGHRLSLRRLGDGVVHVRILPAG